MILYKLMLTINLKKLVSLFFAGYLIPGSWLILNNIDTS